MMETIFTNSIGTPFLSLSFSKGIGQKKMKEGTVWRWIGRDHFITSVQAFALSSEINKGWQQMKWTGCRNPFKPNPELDSIKK